MREHPIVGTLRPVTRAQTTLPLLEASALAAGLPEAISLARTIEARGYFQATIARQWRLIEEAVAERFSAAADATAVARAWGLLPDARARFHLPGAWTRFALGGPAAPSLALLREWSASGGRLVGEWLAESGLRPWADDLGPEIVPLLLPWTQDPEPEVRRAAIVALRPHGVWVPQLEWAAEQPALLLPVFEALRAEHDPRVAGAVANAFNDVARTHPQLALEVLHRWRAEGVGPLVEQIARKGLRGLLKSGDPRALRLLDLPPLRVSVAARLRSGAVARPNSNLHFELTVRNDGPAARAELVYEIETPGRDAARPRRHRVQAGAYLLPEHDRVQLFVRERIFDRRAAPLIAGAGRALFFLNGEQVAEARFRIEREPVKTATDDFDP